MRNNLIKGLVFGSLAVTSVFLTGCFSDSASSEKDASLTMKVALKDVRKDGALAKGQTITLKKLVVKLTSNATTPDVIVDTLIADSSDFSSVATADQSVRLTYNIKPLRDWTIEVKTLDVNDSAIHVFKDSTSALNIKIGETRQVILDLAAQFVMYVANFKLPDSLRASGSSQAQKLYVNRLMMVVDGDTVVDSTRSYFSAGNPGHVIAYDYVKAGVAHQVALFVFADSLNDWDPTKPVFGDTIVVSPSADTTIIPSLPWTGPGSIHDPNYNPNNPGGAVGDLTINIRKVNTVTIDPILDSLIFKRK